jgi:hypothetical protein
LIPTGGFGDVARTGLVVVAGVSRGVAGSRLTLGLEGLYGRAPHALPGERSELYGASVDVDYALVAREPVSVDVSAIVGGLVHAHKSASFPGLDATRTGPSAGARAAISRRVGRVRPFIRVAYTRGFGELGGGTFPTQWLSVDGGLVIPLG